MTLRLVFADERGSRRHVVLAGEITVGRGPGSAIRLEARNVSRRHARFVAAPDGVAVEDLGSRNGTFVNGGAVRGRARLSPGDEVRIGDEVLRVEGAAACDLAAADDATPSPMSRPTPTPPPLPRPAAAADPSAGTVTFAAAVPRPRGWRETLAAALRALVGKDP